MKKQRNYRTNVDDILEAINKGFKFIEDLSMDGFIEDEKTQFALIRVIEIIGEASKKIPQDIKDKYADIPWREMSGMRDKLIHDYSGVNTEVLWKTAKEDFPKLKSQLIKMKEGLD